MTHSEKLKFLEEVYLKEVPNMIKYAEIALGNKALAEDAVQNTFKIALEKIDSFVDSPKPVGWIKITLKHEILHKYREQQQWQKYIIDCELNNISTYDDISVNALFSGFDKQALNLLKKVYIDGLSYNELSKQENVSLSAIKMKINRAKEKLKQQLTLK